MRPTRHALLLAVALAAGTVAPTGVLAADPQASTVGDQVLVRYSTDSTVAQRRAVASDLGLTVLDTSPDSLTQVVQGRGTSPATVRRKLADDPRVIAVSPNYRRELADEITDEPYFQDEWGLYNHGQTIDGTELTTGINDIDIDGLEALRISQGLPSVVVAVIDDGVDFSHQDLAARAWTNPGEVAGNGVDDDHNGFVDDIHGWDFCHNDATLHDAGKDGHGTHVAGTIAASLNGSGVVGIAPGIKIMALKFIEQNNNSCGLDSQAIDAIDYAASFGVPIINASWGGAGDSSVLDSAIAGSGALFVAAAGNAGQNIDLPQNEFFPAESTVPNILAVAAVDQRGLRADFSNYGPKSVDIGAPGTNILSDYPGGYAWIDGTSMAAPHVSGVAALVASTAGGTVTPATLKNRILVRGTPLASMSGKTVTGRLLNAWRAIDVTGPTAQPVSRYSIDAGSVVGSTVSTTISWPAATDQSGVLSYVVRRKVGSGAWTVLANAQTSRSLRTALTVNSLTAFGIAGRDGAGNVGASADSPAVRATMFQEGTSLATYSGRWTTTSSSTASNGKLRTSTQAGAWVQFRRSARSIGIVGRQGPTSGKAKVYVDGVFVATIDLYRSTARSRVVLFSQSWPTAGIHSVKLFVSGTSSRPRIDIDGWAVAY
jgi:subtilisin family serine protease